MGANAQISVPTFTAGEVLTAANMNISARTGIPVFATSVTRDAAFGGTGEKTLAEGQFAYLEDSNTTQYYDGAAWQPVGTSAGLVYLTGATFTTVASVSMAASTFTSTYENYLVTVIVTNSSTTQNLLVRVNNAGTARTAANYYGNKTSGATATATSGGTSFNSCGISNVNFPSCMSFVIYSPVSASIKTTLSGQGVGYPDASASNTTSIVNGVVYDVAEAHDGLTFLVGGTFSGSYKVYGLANS